MNKPGAWLQQLAGRVCSDDAMERFIAPTVADMQHEYAEALRDRRVWHGRWILISGRIAILKLLALQMCAPADAVDADARRRAFVCGLLVTAVVTLLFQGVLLSSVWGVMATTNRWAVAAYAVPQALPIAIACGFVLGLLYGGGRHSRRATSLTLIAAAMVGVISFAAISQIVPRSNYAFRATVTGHDVSPGINELTSSELRERLASDVDEPVRVFGARGDRRYVTVMYDMRAAFSAAAPVLALIALPMLSWRRRMARVAAGAILCVLYVGYFFWLTDETASVRLVALSPATAAWLPNYLIALVAITWMSMSRVRWSRGR